MMKNLWDTVKDKALEAIFPSNIYCIGCGSMIDASRPYSLCDRCIRRLHWIGERTCEKCGKALPDQYRGRTCYDCMTYEHCFTKGYSCLTYGMYERELIFDLKYNGKGYVAEKFGDMLYDRISCEDICPDVIIPVPVSRKKLKERGFNQACLMAERLSYRMGVPVDMKVISRRKDTRPLRGMTPLQRMEMLDGAFALYPWSERRINGKTILLVDDIYTTGATADACSRILSEGGAKEIRVLSLASGGNRKPNI